MTVILRVKKTYFLNKVLQYNCVYGDTITFLQKTLIDIIMMFRYPISTLFIQIDSEKDQKVLCLALKQKIIPKHC